MLKWLPWRFAVKYIARANGFIDPMAVHAQLQKFSQPAEVAEPIELLRAGVVFHARGLINSKVIQHNLDWVWPYWVERQFDPGDLSFLPRAFSVTQINLTHRNWTAIGYPDVDELPIVDPRGLVTPWWDGWSIDAWVLKDDGSKLLPSRQLSCHQVSDYSNGVAVVTSFTQDGLSLTERATVEMAEDGPVCKVDYSALSDDDGWLVISARPCNPEGISLIDDLELSSDRKRWTINKKHHLEFDQPVQRHHTSNYHDGDVHIHLSEKDDVHSQHCPVGVVTAAAMFRLQAGSEKHLSASVPLTTPKKRWFASARAEKSKPQVIASEGSSVGGQSAATGQSSTARWTDALAGRSELRIPDKTISMIYESSVRALVLSSPGDVYAGPYTYKRYWYRDTVFIGYGLLRAGLTTRVKRIVEQLPERQKSNGYYHSQEGEWDSNGQVLWLIHQYYCATGKTIDADLWQSVEKGAQWIIDKRLDENSGQPYAGLLPAGFSAEHLGPNDYYYWDDYWAIAGLDSAAILADAIQKPDLAERYRMASTSLAASVERSLAEWTRKQGIVAIPASPMRRMDAGCIGSVVTGYPLRLCAADDARLKGTVRYLMDSCFCQGGFFQDMIHSGINIYLTLQIAQTLLRNNDSRFYQLLKTCEQLATDTGTWPEAIHPHTRGGCMGDGHHTWAAAEWVSLIRNCFVREEQVENGQVGQEQGSLIIGSGIVDEWLDSGQQLSFGPTPTEFGPVTVTLQSVASQGAMANTDNRACRVDIKADWHHKAPEMILRLPGKPSTTVKEGSTIIEPARAEADAVPS